MSVSRVFLVDSTGKEISKVFEWNESIVRIILATFLHLYQERVVVNIIVREARLRDWTDLPTTGLVPPMMWGRLSISRTYTLNSRGSNLVHIVYEEFMKRERERIVIENLIELERWKYSPWLTKTYGAWIYRRYSEKWKYNSGSQSIFVSSWCKIVNIFVCAIIVVVISD